MFRKRLRCATLFFVGGLLCVGRDKNARHNLILFNIFSYSQVGWSLITEVCGAQVNNDSFPWFLENLHIKLAYQTALATKAPCAQSQTHTAVGHVDLRASGRDLQRATARRAGRGEKGSGAEPISGASAPSSVLGAQVRVQMPRSGVSPTISQEQPFRTST